MTSDLLETILNNYAVDEIVSFEKIAKGLSSNNYKVVTKGGTYFLKNHTEHGGQRIAIVEQAEQFFSSRGIPVISPIKTISEQYHVTVDSNCYVLYPFVTGVQYESGNVDNDIAGVLGTMLGQAHLLSKDIANEDYSEGNFFRFYPKDLLLSEIKELHTYNTNTTKYDTVATEGLALKLSLIESTYLFDKTFDLSDRCMCFGDYYPDNIFFDDQKNITAIFDLDMAGIGPRMFELVRSMMLTCILYIFTDKKIESAKAFVTAYYKAYPFSKDELREAMEYHYLKSFSALWIERSHYKERDYRTDEMYGKTLEEIQYLTEHRAKLLERLCEGIIFSTK